MNDSKRVKLKLLFSLLFFFCAIIMTVQERTIKGTVMDTQGEPIIGANVWLTNFINLNKHDKYE